jgi:hypothetical protein
MIEKVRLSLWDVFSFFLSGFLAIGVFFALSFAYRAESTHALVEDLARAPSALVIAAAPIVFTLLGLLVEPFANYFDRFVLGWLMWWTSRPKKKYKEEEDILKDCILQNHLGPLTGSLTNPYGFCKDYVEANQLGANFMVFLSRYGFYRNCAFLSFASGIACFLLSSDREAGTLELAIGYAISALFKRRAEDFYSLLAPTVYRAFLIDKLSHARVSSLG